MHRNAILEAYTKIVSGMVRWRRWDLSVEMQKDAFSNCMLRMVVAIENFKTSINDNFMGYAHGYIVGGIRDTQQRVWETVKNEDELDAMETWHYVSALRSDEDVETDYVRMEQVDKLLQAARSQLTSRDILILRLFYWKEYTCAEIAAELGVSESLVSKCKRRGMQVLKEVATEMGIGANNDDNDDNDGNGGNDDSGGSHESRRERN